MIDFLFKSSISLVALLLFYHLILEREKMHQFNRFYLLFGLVFSFAIPFITIEVIDESAKTLVKTNTTMIGNTTVKTVVETVDYSQIILWGIYFLITGLLLVRFINNILKINSKITTNTSVDYKNAKLILLKEKTLPHTFWNNIFINETDYHNRKIEEELYTHELIHVTQKHTLDILLIETLKTVFWFNPLFIFYKKAIQLNHEFLADEQVVNSYKNVPFYQNLLLSKANENQTFYLASNLNYSITKKRLIMMTKTTPASIAILKKIAIFPVILALISLTCIEGVAKEKEIMTSTSKEETKTNTKEPNVAVALSYSYIGKSKNQPVFKDNLEKLYRYMGSNYKTPNEISKSGKIVVTFIIEKNGSLTGLKTVEDIGLGTGAEAVRILKSCPNINPGIVDGKSVRTPIALQIEVMVLDKKK